MTHMLHYDLFYALECVYYKSSDIKYIISSDQKKLQIHCGKQFF